MVHTLAYRCSGGHCRRQMIRLFERFWNEEPPIPPLPSSYLRILIVDSVYLSGRTNAVLIGHSGTSVCSWDFADREYVNAWWEFLSHFQTVDVIVMDGQKGLGEAVFRCFPDIRIQRCLAHIEHFVRNHISTKPNASFGNSSVLSGRCGHLKRHYSGQRPSMPGITDTRHSLKNVAVPRKPEGGGIPIANFGPPGLTSTTLYHICLLSLLFPVYLGPPTMW